MQRREHSFLTVGMVNVNLFMFINGQWPKTRPKFGYRIRNNLWDEDTNTQSG